MAVLGFWFWSMRVRVGIHLTNFWLLGRACDELLLSQSGVFQSELRHAESAAFFHSRELVVAGIFFIFDGDCRIVHGHTTSGALGVCQKQAE